MQQCNVYRVCVVEASLVAVTVTVTVDNLTRGYTALVSQRFEKNVCRIERFVPPIAGNTARLTTGLHGYSTMLS